MRQRALDTAFVVTDLEEGNSDTLQHGAETTAAYRTLLAGLPRARHVNRILDNVRHDSGVYAQLQAEVCARAALLVTCEDARSASRTTGRWCRRLACASSA